MKWTNVHAYLSSRRFYIAENIDGVKTCRCPSTARTTRCIGSNQSACRLPYIHKQSVLYINVNKWKISNQTIHIFPELKSNKCLVKIVLIQTVNCEIGLSWVLSLLISETNAKWIPLLPFLLASHRSSSTILLSISFFFLHLGTSCVERNLTESIR